jgi:para-aminobenzoate synthetase component 1
VSGVAVAECVREIGRGQAADLLSRFAALRRRPCPWLLDSALAHAARGRFSFAGADPWLVLRARGRSIEIECRRAVHPRFSPGVRRFEGDPFDALRDLLAAHTVPAGPRTEAVPFAGGAVGYFGYGLSEHTEPVRLGARTECDPPDLVLLFADRLLALDHAERRLFACGLGFGPSGSEARAAARAASEGLELGADRAEPLEDVGDPPAVTDARAALRALGARSDFDAERYAEAVARVKREIAAGNVYQANLSQRIEVPARGDPWRLYRALRRVNPAPFAAYLELPELAVLSASPERFLHLTPGGDVESRPIKGTRPRGATPERDASARAELLASAKDRAENVMIVDLVRNDLGKVCEPGSVRVTELASPEAYATVHQLVSSVRGRLRAGRGAVDLLRGAFPPGSMTGAPKLAALRLIDALEVSGRGVYAGALGYLDWRGGMDLSVVIRTVLVSRGTARLQVGGGIVADSEGPAEYQETLDKAWASLQAMLAIPPGDEEAVRDRDEQIRVADVSRCITMRRHEQLR